MSLDDERARITAQQDALVDALLGNGPSPAGFEPAVLERVRHTLEHKRAWVAARREARIQTPAWVRLWRWIRASATRR